MGVEMSGGAKPVDRLPPDSRRPVDRRRDDRHARPLARADRDHGAGSGQARVRRKAVLSQRARGATAARSGAPDRQSRSARHAVSLQPVDDAGDGAVARWSDRRRASIEMLELAVAQGYRPHEAERTAVGRRLRHLGRSGRVDAVPGESFPLRLALVVQLWLRRPGQRRHPRVRLRAVGLGRRYASERRVGRRRQVFLRRRSAVPRHAAGHV